MHLKYKKLRPNAITPTKANLDDAGWDLYSTGFYHIPPQSRCMVKTGIAFEIPKGCAGLIWPRSGMSSQFGIDVLAGVIDSGYRGEISVCLFNTSSDFEGDVYIAKGDRIAQIVMQPILNIKLEESEELSDSERGDGGFGSSGK